MTNILPYYPVRSLKEQIKVPNTEPCNSAVIDAFKTFMCIQLDMGDVGSQYAKLFWAVDIVGIERSQEHVKNSELKLMRSVLFRWVWWISTDWPQCLNFQTVE